MQFKLLKNKEKTKENSALKNKKIQEKSRGRSMVEMLGVLAIIGVLSIGGIQGYTLAMRKYRANEILTNLSKYALTIYSEWQNKMLNYPEDYVIEEIEDDNGTGYYDAVMLHSTLSYSDSGLGSFPIGLKKIEVKQHIIKKESGDIILMRAWFDSKELCETVVNTLGVNREHHGYGGWDDWFCNNTDSILTYAAPLYFIMN